MPYASLGTRYERNVTLGRVAELKEYAPAAKAISNMSHLVSIRRSDLVLACLVKEPIRPVRVEVREDRRIPKVVNLV